MKNRGLESFSPSEEDLEFLKNEIRTRDLYYKKAAEEIEVSVTCLRRMTLGGKVEQSTINKLKEWIFFIKNGRSSEGEAYSIEKKTNSFCIPQEDVALLNEQIYLRNLTLDIISKEIDISSTSIRQIRIGKRVEERIFNKFKEWTRRVRDEKNSHR